MHARNNRGLLDDRSGNTRAHPVMNQDQVVVGDILQGAEAIQNRMLPFSSAGDDAPHLCQSVPLDDMLPAVGNFLRRNDKVHLVDVLHMLKN